jgi:DNA-binding NarL/FixJ family response regulator
MTIVDLDALLNLRGWKLVSRPEPQAPLSPREEQILGLVAGGRTQKETAFELGVSDATVRVLYSRAMKKLGRSKQPRPKRAAQL